MPVADASCGKVVKWRSSKSQRQLGPCRSRKHHQALRGAAAIVCSSTGNTTSLPLPPLPPLIPPHTHTLPHARSHTRARPSHFVQAACSRSRGSDRVPSSPTLSRCNARGFVRHPRKPARARRAVPCRRGAIRSGRIAAGAGSAQGCSRRAGHS